MLAKDIVIGSTYRCRVSGRLALVKVISDRGGSGRRFTCLTQDTARTIRASAAKLRPVPGSDAAEAERTRLLKAAARRAAANAPRPWSLPDGLEMTYRIAVPVHGMIGAVGRLPVMNFTSTDAEGVARVVDRMHCAEPVMAVCRRIRRALSAKWQWRTIPAELRRSILLEGIGRHSMNRRLYRDVMGHDAPPSGRMIADAVGTAVGLGPCPR